VNGESFIVTVKTYSFPAFWPYITIALVAVCAAVYLVRRLSKSKALRKRLLVALLVLAVPTAPLGLYNTASLIVRRIETYGDSLESRPEIAKAVAQHYGAEDVEKVSCPDSSFFWDLTISCVTYDGGKTIVRVSIDRYHEKGDNTSDYLVTVAPLTSSKEVAK